MSADLASYFILAWVVGVVAVFPSLKPHRGMLVIVLTGALFLPEAVPNPVEFGPVKFAKQLAIGYAALFAALLYSGDRLFSPGIRWFDWPMVVWCLIPIPSTFLNEPPPDGGSYLRDAVSQTLTQCVFWGVPYLMGRLYFTDRDTLRDLVVAVVIAAAIYAPLCLFEARMSPQLHRMVYGYHQHDFSQTVRFEGFRPTVFLQHGLAVGMFMVTGALMAAWLRRAGQIPGYFALLLVPVAVLIKSSGAIALGLSGGVVLWLSAATKSRWWLLALIAVAPTYSIARGTGTWTGTSLVQVISDEFDANRAQSLAFRLTNEDMLVEHAAERPLFGWGIWGRNLIQNDAGENISVPDGFWVITLGTRGIVGLTAIGLALLLPAARFALGTDPGRWTTPELAPAAACAVVVTLWCIDCVLNAMPNAVYPLIAGALGSSVGYADKPSAATQSTDPIT